MKLTYDKKYAGPLILAVALLLAILGYYILRPQQATAIENTQAEIAETEQNMREYASQNATAAQELPRLRAESEEMRSELAERERQIPTRPEMTSLMMDLNSLTDAHALEYRGVEERGRVQVTAGLYRINYEMTVVGRFSDVVGFIDSLQGLQRYVVVTTFDLSAGNGNPTAPQINTRIMFSTFVRGDLPTDENT